MTQSNWETQMPSKIYSFGVTDTSTSCTVSPISKISSTLIYSVKRLVYTQYAAIELRIHKIPFPTHARIHESEFRGSMSRPHRIQPPKKISAQSIICKLNIRWFQCKSTFINSIIVFRITILLWVLSIWFMHVIYKIIMPSSFLVMT